MSESGSTGDNPSDLTPKARQTRAHILHTALALFAKQGYQDTTLREIAAAAECSLGLTYRYFSRKEELILELYSMLTRELAEEVDRLPRAGLAARFTMAMQADLKRLAPHRTALEALFGAGLSQDSEVALLGERVTPIRAAVWRVCLQIVGGSRDAPGEKQSREMATLFYALYLLLVLFWLQDRSPGQALTQDLLRLIRDLIGLFRPVLGLRPAARVITRLVRILTPMLGPPPGLKADGGAEEDAG